MHKNVGLAVRSYYPPGDDRVDGHEEHLSITVGQTEQTLQGKYIPGGIWC